MNKEYWKNFYERKGTIKTPSSFAHFFVNSFEFLTPDVSIVDLGCGNCRDTRLIALYSNNVTGVDYSSWAPDVGYKFVQSDIEKYIKNPCSHDIVYSRFFFHSISDKTIDKILKWTKDALVAEFRVIGDKPTLYTNHKRNLIDSEAFLKKLIKMNYKVLFFQVGSGLAQYKNEDPLVCRVIATKVK